jgi:DNA-directed RNA polymerase subunit M/transcription elongation factor TFIIS
MSKYRKRKAEPEIDRTCFKCRAIMDIVNDDELLECPNCGNSFYADDRDFAYEQWKEEQEEESGFYDYDDDDYDDDYDESEEPECCRACGGPWPDCESSCTIFDD